MPSPVSPGTSLTLLVLGTSGGPCETASSGYLLKPSSAKWTDGFISVEGGAGVGALGSLIAEEEARREIRHLRRELGVSRGALQKQDEMDVITGIGATLDEVEWPASCDTPTLRAGYLFSFLSGYIVTHGHLDHIASMVLSTGTLPSRLIPSVPSTDNDDPSALTHPKPPLRRVEDPQASRRCIYGAKEILKEVETAYGGVIWPELAVWAKTPWEGDDGHRSHARRGQSLSETQQAEPTTSDERAKQVAQEPLIHRSSSRTPPPPPKRKLSLVALRKKFLKTPGRPPSAVSISPGAGSQDQGIIASPPKDDDGYAQRKEVAGGQIETEEPGTTPPATQSTRKARQPWWIEEGVGVQLCPMPSTDQYQTLPYFEASTADSSVSSVAGSRRTLSVMHMPVAHGNNSKGAFGSSAFFIRLDEAGPESSKESDAESIRKAEGMEFLFWGDVESRSGLESDDLNRAVWREAARRWDRGKLGAVFIECSFDGQRVSSQMYGHLQPALLHAELRIMAGMCAASSSASGPPLQALKVYVIHVKETFVPDSAGRSVRERVIDELREIQREEEEAGRSALGVEFIAAERGMMIQI